MAVVVAFCVWFGCPDPLPPAHIHEDRSESIVSLSVAPDTYPSGVEQWRSLVAAYFPPSEVERALCIMGHESNGSPTAVNPSSGAAGLFQFLPSTWDSMVPDSIAGGSYASGAPFNPETNVASAAWLQGAEGWTQWSPYKRGLCH